MTAGYLDELRWRGLIHQTTADDHLPGFLNSGTRTGYCGFDPTNDSLTIGNLMPIMLLGHLQRHGHRPVVLIRTVLLPGNRLMAMLLWRLLLTLVCHRPVVPV